MYNGLLPQREAMRIFVGYGYNERDRWVEEYAIPLITAFGCEILHGKTVYGGAVPDEVMKLIRSSDAMIGFTTRRDLLAAGAYSTHPWVVQELLTAHAQEPRIPWVEVREEGVALMGGILEAADTQRINYRAEDRAGCLVQIAQALRRLRELTSVTMIRLGPSEAVEQISGLLADRSFVCTCDGLIGVRTAQRPAAVYPIKGGLFVQLRGIVPGELIRITLSAKGRTWRSDYESVDTVDVRIRE